ncbi:hypothetical protein BOX37_28025 [Nocardia mangyaensis]|uniref:Uncharacterized protein n=1 Tax=Nocardia mangyaensis TaxID=2213200 RepID=A0A1J0VYJ8_9NOCA|nr:Gfo/Idh/MocA family oxidoreductase [Nocardia mangyaensis]APE37139.1 hypothetical protein BOX37_28025 [Nocardia mangyaensis]MBC7299344.1 Gfo/Idh/MocA family oxidoreductase [Nocardia sp.]
MINNNAPRPLRVGVVGMGWFGRTHLDAWSSVRGATVVAVCDRDPAAMADVGDAPQEAFHSDAGSGGRRPIPAGVARYEKLQDMLAAGVDLVDVVTTESEHEWCIRTALEAGADVVVEKPIALDPAAAHELVELARARDRHLYVAQVLRFDPRYIALSEMVAGSTLRHLSFARTFQSVAHQVYGRTHPVLNAAVHDIDIAVWLVGRAPERVSAYGSHLLGHEHPDCIDLVLEWGPLRAVIQNSWHLASTCPFGFTFDATIQAAEGTWTLRSEPVIHAWTTAQASAPEMWLWPRYGGARQGALVSELQHITDCVADGRDSDRVPLSQVLDVMETCHAAITALSSGQPQTLTKAMP